MPKLWLIAQEQTTIMSHSRGRQQKKYFPLSQCFPELQANSVFAELSEKDCSDSSWSGWVVVPELKTIHMLPSNLEPRVKREYGQNHALFS